MKKLVTLLLVFALFSCTTYKEYISVSSITSIPNGTKSLVVTNSSAEAIKQVFADNQILYNTFSTGIETEIIMIDEGTKAQYKVYILDNSFKIVAYYGITDKVKAQMIMWAGTSAASAYSTETMNLIIYDNKSTRPKKVFDYLVQLLDSSHIEYHYK